MERYFLYAGISLCLFSLWAIARHDWLRLFRISRSVTATIIGHRESWDSDGKSFARVYRFSAEGGEHEVIDQVYRSIPRPEIGTEVKLNFPFGRPDLARPPRPWMWLAVYTTLIWLTGMLFAKLFGWLH